MDTFVALRSKHTPRFSSSPEHRLSISIAHFTSIPNGSRAPSEAGRPSDADSAAGASFTSTGGGAGAGVGGIPRLNDGDGDEGGIGVGGDGARI